MNEGDIQREIVRALNQAYAEPWSAFAATTRDGLEYVELTNEQTGSRFVISIQKGQ